MNLNYLLIIKNIREKWEVLQYLFISPWFLSRFPMIYLENLRGLSLKSSSLLSPMNPPKIPINSAVQGIPEESTGIIPLNVRVDSRFTYHLTFRADSPPPSIHLPRGFPAESVRFCPLGCMYIIFHKSFCVRWLSDRNSIRI